MNLRITRLLILILVFHFTMTLIYVSPLNHQIVDLYMTPLFKQGWKLFAPDPRQKNYTVYVSTEYTKSNGEVENSDWVNMSSSLIKKNHSHLFSEVNRTLRSQLVGLLDSSFPDSLPNHVIKEEVNNHYHVNMEAKEVQDYRSKVFSVLERYASAYVRKHNPQREINKIKPRITVEDTATGEKKCYMTGWLPYQDVKGYAETR